MTSKATLFHLVAVLLGLVGATVLAATVAVIFIWTIDQTGLSGSSGELLVGLVLGTIGAASLTLHRWADTMARRWPVVDS